MEETSQTLYLNNLNEKIKKNILKKTLYALFSQYGKVIEIIACKGIKLRGQVKLTSNFLLLFYCFLLFFLTYLLTLLFLFLRHGLYMKILHHQLQQLEGYKDLIYMINLWYVIISSLFLFFLLFLFYSTSLHSHPPLIYFEIFQRIAFAKTKSDIISKKDGTFVPREKRPREESNENDSVKERNTSTSVDNNSNNNNNNSSKSKLLVNNVPHRILFAQNVPDECNDRILSMLFQPFPGFQEVRMVPGKKGIAFIEFQDVIQAGIALQQLNGFQLMANETLQLTYAKQ